MDHITRFDYENTSFAGWRVSVCRFAHRLTRYFSDREYDGKEEALKAAMAFRGELLTKLEGMNKTDVLRLKAQLEDKPPYPKGLHPRRAGK